MMCDDHEDSYTDDDTVIMPKYPRGVIYVKKYNLEVTQSKSKTVKILLDN